VGSLHHLTPKSFLIAGGQMIRHDVNEGRLMKKQDNPSLKAHLLRCAIYVLLAVCAIPFALAQPCSVTSACGITVFVPPTVFDVNVSEPVDPTSVQPSDFMCNGIPADSATLINGNLTIEFTYNTSPAVPGVNTIHIPAGAFSCGPVVDFTCTFGYRVFPTPRPRPTPGEHLSPPPTPASI
jgi:hypothetical protein